MLRPFVRSYTNTNGSPVNIIMTGSRINIPNNIKDRVIFGSFPV